MTDQEFRPHAEAWLANVAEPLRGAQFRPYNAATSVALAMEGIVVPFLYAVGVLACVYHLANGIWTMGITWGIWISDAAQQRASWVCTAFGIGLAIVGLTSLYGTKTVDLGEARDAEQLMYDAKLDSGEFAETVAEHKRWSEEEIAEKVQPAIDEQGRDAERETTSAALTGDTTRH